MISWKRGSKGGRKKAVVGGRCREKHLGLAGHSLCGDQDLLAQVLPRSSSAESHCSTTQMGRLRLGKRAQLLFLANSLQAGSNCPAGLTWGQSQVEGLLAQCRISHSPASLSPLGWTRTLYPWGRWRLPSRRQMADSENPRVPPPTGLLVL